MVEKVYKDWTELIVYDKCHRCGDNGVRTSVKVYTTSNNSCHIGVFLCASCREHLIDKIWEIIDNE